MNDEYFIRRCINLSAESIKNGDAPFGVLIVKNGEIISESVNKKNSKITDHAEIVALNLAHKRLKTSNLSECTLYSNCEPCPMCAFMAREFRVKRVVFAISSPFMGGFLKWKILQDETLGDFEKFFGKPPEIISNLLEDEALEVFRKNKDLWMFGNKFKN